MARCKKCDNKTNLVARFPSGGVEDGIPWCEDCAPDFRQAMLVPRSEHPDA